MIIEQINKANIEAMRQKDEQARVVLGIVKNKYMMQSIEKRTKNEEMKDEDMVQIISKTIKELTEEHDNYAKVNNAEMCEKIIYQKEFITKFMPKLMSEEEIDAVINSLEDKSIPSVMKHFKMNYAGKCDMGLVMQRAKK